MSSTDLMSSGPIPAAWSLSRKNVIGWLRSGGSARAAARPEAPVADRAEASARRAGRTRSCGAGYVGETKSTECARVRFCRFVISLIVHVSMDGAVRDLVTSERIDAALAGVAAEQ